MIELGTEIPPHRHTVTGLPPGCEGQVHHVDHADDRCRTYEDAEQKADAYEGFNRAHEISEEHSVRQHEAGQKRPVTGHRTIRDEVVKVFLKAAVGKPATGKLVFAE